jgi:DNA end-binding protein Ku
MAESVRTFWKGHLRLALVTIPVRLVSAQKTDSTVTFHQIDRQTKQRIRYKKVAAGKDEVAKEDIVMGYEYEPGAYVLIEDEELDSLKLQTRHTIELTQFVDSCEIDPLYFERPYYVLPDGEVAEEGYVIIRDALRAKRKVGIGQLTLRGRESLVCLYVGGNGLVLDTLRYEAEIKDADSVFAGVKGAKPRADMIEMAEELIDRRSQSFDPSQFKNHYSEALRELISAKLSKGESVAVAEDDEPKGAKVLDFMEALRRSVQSEGGAAPPAAAKHGKPKAAKTVKQPAARTPKAGKAAQKSPPRKRA